MISSGELNGESKKVSAGFHPAEVGLAGMIHFKEFYLQLQKAGVGGVSVWV